MQLWINFNASRCMHMVVCFVSAALVFFAMYCTRSVYIIATTTPQKQYYPSKAVVMVHFTWYTHCHRVHETHLIER